MAIGGEYAAIDSPSMTMPGSPGWARVDLTINGTFLDRRHLCAGATLFARSKLAAHVLGVANRFRLEDGGTQFCLVLQHVPESPALALSLDARRGRSIIKRSRATQASCLIWRPSTADHDPSGARPNFKPLPHMLWRYRSRSGLSGWCSSHSQAFFTMDVMSRAPGSSIGHFRSRPGIGPGSSLGVLASSNFLGPLLLLGLDAVRRIGRRKRSL